MAEYESRLKITADGNAARAEIAATDKSLKNLGATADGVGKGTGLDTLAQKTGQAAAKIDRDTASMQRSFERMIATREAAGKGQAAYMESLVNQRGLDPAVFQSYIEKMRAMEAAQSAVGQSAAATANAMRMVPAQMTDIIVSLQGGQKPMTVLLQQGGQLKDMFGGVGAAAKALGGYVLGLVNPFTVGAAAAATLATAYYKGSQESIEFQKALTLSGNAAGATAGQMQTVADAIGATGRSRGAAVDALTAIAGSGDVAASSLQKFSTVAIDMERATGQAIGKTAEQFTELGRSPAEASAKLNEQYRYLTASIYDQIKALENEGRSVDAARLAQDSYANAMGARAQQVITNAGLMEKAWHGVTTAASNAWQAMLNIGKAQTSTDKLTGINAELARLQNEQANTGFASSGGGAAFGRPNAGADGQRSARIQQLQAERAALMGLAHAEAENAKATAARQAQDQAGIKWSQAGEKYLSKQAQMERELAQARQLGQDAGKSQADIEQRLGEIRAKYADKKGGSKSGVAPGENEIARIRAMIKEEEAYSTAIGQRGAAAEKLTSGEKMVLQIQQQLETGLKGVARANKEASLAEALKLSAVQRSNRASEEQAKLLDVQNKFLGDRSKYYQSVSEETDAIAAKNSALDLENQKLGASKEQLRAYAQATVDATIAKKGEKLAIVEMFDAQGDEAEQLRKQIELLKQRKQIMSAGYAKEDMLAEQQGMLGMWQSIDKTAHDVFVNVFEDGAGTFKRLGQTLKSALLDMLYQMTVKRWIINIAASVTGSTVGMVGQVFGGGQGGGLGGLLGNASNGSSLLNLFGGTGGNVGALRGLLGGSMSWGNAVGSVYANTTGTGISGLLSTNGAYGTAAGGGWGGLLGGAGAVGLPLLIGSLAERNSRERVSGAAFATSDYRNDPRVNTTGTAYDPISGTMPSHDALVAAARDAGMSDADLARFGNGNDRALYQWVSSAGTKPNNDSGYNPGQNIDGLLSGKYASNFYQGQGYAHPEAMGWWNDKGYNLASNDPAATELSRTVATSIVAPMTDIARTLGQSADDLRVTVGYATRGDGNGVWAGMRVERGGQTVSDWTNMDDYHSVGEAVRGMYSQALNVLSTDFNLPQWAEQQATAARAEMDKLSGDNLAEQAAALYQSTTTEIAKTFAQIQQLIDIFPDFSNATQDSVHALAEAMGGMDQLTSSYQSYVSHFYSSAEQQAFAWQQIETALSTVGVTMPHTREEFRALVESLDLNTEAGRNTFAVLMSVEGAFAQLTESAGNAGEALGMTKDSVASMLKGILDEAQSAQEARTLGEQKAGEMFMGAITSAMVNSVSDALMNAVIGPLVGQITAGAATAAAIDVAGATASAGTLVAGGAGAGGAMAAGGSAAGNNMAAGGAAAATGLAAVVQQTVSVVNNIAQVFSTPEFQAAFHDFSSAIGDLSASMFDARANIGAAVGFGSGGGFGGGGSGGGMGGGGGKELNDLADAIQRLGETAADEVKRLRGLITEESEFGQATLLAKFATTTAAARAGDTKALEALPELSKSIEQITAATAVTNIENVRMRAWLADSIEQTLKTLGVKVPAFAAGTNYVPSTMLAMVHEGERIVPAADNRALMAAIGGSDNGELVAEVRELRKQVSALQSRAEQTVRNTAGLPQLVEQFDNVTDGGNAMREVPA